MVPGISRRQWNLQGKENDRRKSAKKQNLMYAGVNAHHQNGIAKRRIRELQETTRLMLIHASRWWPGVVTIHL